MAKLNLNTFTADHIRLLYNASIEGTATDALIRHRCRVALAECCIGTNQQAPAVMYRYPTPPERLEATKALVKFWNRMRVT